MSSHSSVTTAQILQLFGEEITARSGRILETFEDQQRLISRSVLPFVEEVRRDDRVQGGVALRVNDEGICIYPYVFREVCRNGAIVAQTLAGRCIENLDEQDAEPALELVREGIVACCEPEVFLETVCKMRTASATQVDVVLGLLPLISRNNITGGTNLLRLIMDQFVSGKDTSQFGLANAITAVARDTRNPDLRWDLEEYGGGIAVGSIPRQPTNGGYAIAMESRRAVAVG